MKLINGTMPCGRTAICLFAVLPFFVQNGFSQSSPAQDKAPAATGPRADIIFMHANIYTGVPANTQFSSILREEAIAVRGDRIQAVGKTLEIEKLKGPQTQIIDLGGHFVMAGFNDAHLHLDDAGATKLSMDLTGIKSLDDLRDRVSKKVAESKAGDWILGAGWDESLWPVRTTPSRWDLDEVSGGHPVFLVRIDGHIAVANSWEASLSPVAIRRAERSIATKMASPPGSSARLRRQPSRRWFLNRAISCGARESSWL